MDSDQRNGTLNILLVEDNPGDVFIIKDLLNSSGTDLSITHSPSLTKAIELSGKHIYDVILLDLGLPESNGLETLKRFLASEVTAPVIVMTGLNDEETALASVREGAQDYLVKSYFTSDNILRAIKYGIERKKIQDIQKKYTAQFSKLSNATAAINECNDIRSIYETLCHHYTLLLNGSSILALEIIDQSAIRVLCNIGLESFLEHIRTTNTAKSEEPFFTFDDHLDFMLIMLKDGKIHEIDGGISTLFNDTNKKRTFEEFEKRLKISNTYILGLTRGNRVYGGVIFFQKTVITQDDQQIIETIGNQASLSIQRRHVEYDLKLSEIRYRKLNEELELKVQDRTKDLAEINQLLFKSSEEFRTLAENSPDSIVRLDTNLKHLYLNPVAKKIWGENSIGKSWIESGFPQDFHDYWATLVKKVISTRKTQIIEHNYISHDDEDLHYLLSQIVPEFDEKKKISTLLIISRDITEKIRAEEQLKKNASDLKELNATKDKFFGIIAHDLRNPFSSLLGASEILSSNVRQYDIDSIESFSKLSYEAAKSCYALLENLLEWSRSQTGNLKFNPQQVSISEIIDDNISIMRTIAANKKIKLTSKILFNDFILADRDMLQAIIRNLLNNALKFTCINGEVSIIAARENNHLLITIKDNGIGIPEKDIDKLFRIDIKYTKIGTGEERGTGLGLLLCKEFVEQHGGKIWVESIEGKGSEFKLTIPLRSDNLNPAKPEKTKDVKTQG